MSETSTQCCCQWGAAIGKRHGVSSDEWPEFDCSDCPTHGGETHGHRCKRHRKDRDMHEHVEPPTGRECAHCGKPQRGEAVIDGRPVCHTSGAYPDCYRLVSVYGEALGSRHPRIDSDRVRRLLNGWNQMLRDAGIATGDFDAPTAAAEPEKADDVERDRDFEGRHTRPAPPMSSWSPEPWELQ